MSIVKVDPTQVQVDPLTPQPLSASVTSSRNQTAANLRGDSTIQNERVEDPPEFERYKCEICYEYMNDPVGCGKCASRFCRACLQRVHDSDVQKQQPTKCPVCRCEYTEMVSDDSLYGGANGERMPSKISLGRVRGVLLEAAHAAWELGSGI